MKLEHVALQVRDPAAIADWYVRNLGFTIRRASDDGAVVRFIADSSGSVMFELYYNPAAPVPDYATTSPVLFHLAYTCQDQQSTVPRLIAAGAVLLSGPERIGDDEFSMLRDPWGLPIQLVWRCKAMV